MRRLLLLLLLCLAPLLSACNAAATPANAQTATVDGVTISFEAPPQPKVLDAATLRVTLKDASNQPIENADVYFDLTMPAMPMGKNQPIASAQGQGVYTAQAAFDMAGDWKITVHATIDGKEHQATFDALVNEQDGSSSGGHSHSS